MILSTIESTGKRSQLPRTRWSENTRSYGLLRETRGDEIAGEVTFIAVERVHVPWQHHCQSWNLE